MRTLRDISSGLFLGQADYDNNAGSLYAVIHKLKYYIDYAGGLLHVFCSFSKTICAICVICGLYSSFFL
jgi:hypothetical protein